MRLLALLLGTLVLGGLLATLGVADVAPILSRASIPHLAAFAAVSGAVFAVYALRARLVLRGINAPSEPDLATLALFRAAAHSVNFLVPSAHIAGEPVRALLFRRIGFPWGDAFLAVMADRWIEATASAITGPAYVTIFLYASRLDPWIATGPIVVWAIASAAMIAAYVVAARRGRLLSILARGKRRADAAVEISALEGRFADFLRTRWFPLSIAAGLLAEALIVVEFVLLLRAFAIDVPVSTVLGILLGMGVSYLAPVPAGVGSIEGAEVGVMVLAGAGASLGLAVALLVRLRETLWTIVGLAYLWRVGDVALWRSFFTRKVPKVRNVP